MEKVENAIRYRELFCIYGPLLSKAQEEILQSYFVYDLSISEISQERSVSRAAIEDAISKGKTKLEDYESRLNILSRNENIRKKCANLKEKASNCEEIREIEDIERSL